MLSPTKRAKRKSWSCAHESVEQLGDGCTSRASTEKSPACCGHAYDAATKRYEAGERRPVRTLSVTSTRGTVLNVPMR
eukprot:2129982-Pyramimonas_sp.AAC.1